MAQVVARFGPVLVDEEGWVRTPAGIAHVSQMRVVYEATVPDVGSRGVWSVPVVLMAIVVGVFTCGLGFLLLAVGRRERVATRIMDVVSFQGPGWAFQVTAPGGATFAAWLTGWGEQARVWAEYQQAVTAIPAQPVRAIDVAGNPADPPGPLCPADPLRALEAGGNDAPGG